MICKREGNEIRFACSSVERKILERALRAIIENYRLKPDQLDDKTAAVWYPKRGCASAKMSAEETADWLNQLQSFRSARSEMLQALSAQLAAKKQGPVAFRIPFTQAEQLMIALNDHRLWVAARKDIGEEEMQARTLAALAELPPQKQTALWEIEFLAYVIDDILQILMRDA